MRLNSKVVVKQGRELPTKWIEFKDKIDLSKKYLFISPNVATLLYGEIVDKGTEGRHISGKRIDYVRNELHRRDLIIEDMLDISTIYRREALLEITDKDEFFLDCIKTIKDLHKFIECLDGYIKFY